MATKVSKVSRNFFQQVNADAERAGIQKRSANSSKWFIDHLKNIKNLRTRYFLEDKSLTKKNKPLIGRMFMFFYDPKSKDTLPYYDRFPLIIMIGPAPKGFYGLNLHYLHPRLRAIFFDKLMDYTSNNNFDDNTRLRLTYNMLSGISKLRLFQPCFKRYLFKQVNSRTVEVHPDDWEIALFLPTDTFEKENRNHVWNESKKYNTHR